MEQIIFKIISKLRKIWRSLYTKQEVLLFKADEVKDLKSEVVIRKATFENIKDVLSFQDEKYLDIFLKFLRKGDIGFLAYLNKECVHRSWVKKAQKIRIHWALKEFEFKEDELYIHYCETSPKARGHGIYPFVLNFIVKNNKDKDVYISTNSKNIASIKGIQKAGFKCFARWKVNVFLGVKKVVKVE